MFDSDIEIHTVQSNLFSSHKGQKDEIYSEGSNGHYPNLVFKSVSLMVTHQDTVSLSLF